MRCRSAYPIRIRQKFQQLFDELDSLTSEDFAGLKQEIDSILAGQLKIGRDKLMPWHYQNRFFQEAPKIYKSDPDQYYAGKDILTGSYCIL